MLRQLNASQTKYGIIHLIDLVRDGHLEDYITGNYTISRTIDEPQLRGTLGIENITDPLPNFWIDIAEYPDSVGYFCLIAIIFSHHNYIEIFKNSASSNEAMKGVIHRTAFNSQKTFTNIRGILIESGSTEQTYERSEDVPYDFSNFFLNGEVGSLVKNLILNRLLTIGWQAPSITEEFTRDFYDQCYWYEFHKVLNLTKEQYKTWLEGQPLNLSAEFSSESINYEEEIEVDTLLLTSLAAKPFMIITGPSGTGKTYGIRKLAKDLNPFYEIDKHFNITFIPVEAGWKDGRHLIGYQNPFSENGNVYEITPLIDLLLRANSTYYENIPFFAILDEMNLSHVEMYFAKFLSLIETTNHTDLSREPLLTVNELELLKKNFKNNFSYTKLINEAIYNGGLFVSRNVFFVGTVNIDETTYMFSPKVLDRAFVIEINTIKPSELFGNISTQYEQMTRESAYNILLNEYTDEINPHLIQFLDEVYEILENDFPFGFRVVSECNKFFVVVEEMRSLIPAFVREESSIYDEILMQKILPKIHGNRKQLTDILKSLISFCLDSNGNVKYPKSHKKLESMQKNLLITGYSGFVV